MIMVSAGDLQMVLDYSLNIKLSKLKLELKLEFMILVSTDDLEIVLD